MTFAAIVILLGLVALIARWVRTSERRAGREGPNPADILNAIERAEVKMLSGESAAAYEALREAEPLVGRLKGPDGCLLRARHGLALADYASWGGQRDKALECARGALDEIERIDDPEMARELRIRAMATIGLQSLSAESDRDLIETGQRALEDSPNARRPEVIVHLVWFARHLGLMDHARGQWDPARAELEKAVRLGERLARPGTGLPESSWDPAARELFWSLGRKAASEAARDLGTVLVSLGEREAGLRWLDHAIALLEGGDHPAAKLGRAEALFVRALHEAQDPIEGAGVRTGLLERAVECGVGSGLAAGRAVACRADDALGTLYFSLGRPLDALSHLRRAHEHVKDLGDPASTLHAVHSSLRLGQALEETGDPSGACASLERAFERGREDANPEARLHAATAGYELHRLLLERNRIEDGALIVQRLEAMIPGLASGPREVFAGMVARSRGLQHSREGKLDEARRSLEHAQEIGGQVAGPNGWQLTRMTATDLGCLELQGERLAEAEAHFRQALDAPISPEASASDRANLAEVALYLGQTLAKLERRAEAITVLSRTLDQGRDCGNAQGREVAALSALWLGDLLIDDPDRRRKYYEIGGRLGRLSGRERGRHVAEAVEARLREMAD